MERNHGSGLLLRLFESSFFNVHLAVAYLKTYPSSIGITHYLVDRLRHFPADQVELYWAQLCYLAVTASSSGTAGLVDRSRAIENFVFERCTLDPHIAVITLWYMQSTLTDWSATPSAPQFETCKRMYNRVQQLLYSDPTPPPPTSQATATPTPTPTPTAKEIENWLPELVYGDTLKLKVNVPNAALVGMGVIAGAIASPALASSSKAMILEQSTVPTLPSARSDDQHDNESDEEEDITSSAAATKPAPETKPTLVVNGQKATADPTSPPRKKKASQKALGVRPSYMPGPRIESSSNVSVASRTYNTQSTTSVSFLPSPSYINGNGSSNVGSLSVPSLPLSKSTPTLPSSPSQPLSTMPEQYLAHLLILQACRSQLDLIRSLEDISTRLIAVPKLARVSALRAELTVLNHGLPRGCCMCMHCSGSPFRAPDTDTPVKPSRFKKGRPHDRVVRIAPSESVVLNSADRAPFLVHVEVLEGDLDFDPHRRQNYEDLRRALGRSSSSSASSGLDDGQEHRKRKSEGGNNDMSRSASVFGSPSLSDPAAATRTATPPPLTPSPSRSTPTSIPTLTSTANATRGDVPEGEMDLVEQLYGDLSLHAPPTSPPMSPTIQNRSVDERAWARLPSGTSGSSATSGSKSASSVLLSSATAAKPAPFHPKPGGRTVSTTRPTLSIDDYAERMRMAAIMLSQLDASQTAARGMVATGTAAAGTLVGLPKATVLSIGGVVGDAVGALTYRIMSSPTASASTANANARQGRKESVSKAAVAAAAIDDATADTEAGQGHSGRLTTPDTATATTINSSSPVPHHEALTNGTVGSSSNGASATTSAATTAATSASAVPPARHRVLSPVDAQAIRDRIMTEMMALEEERMERMRLDGESRSVWAREQSKTTEDGSVVMRAVNKEDPSGAMVAESFDAKKARIRAASPYGHLANWNVMSVIVKTGADLRQEQFAIQLIKEFGRIWSEEGCPHWVRYFRIMVTSESTGMIETITDAVSVHSIRKNAYAAAAVSTPAPAVATATSTATAPASQQGQEVVASYSMYDHFVKTYGEPMSSTFRRAQDKFLQSLASYSVICYLLQLKDRHNGNILIDKEGHVVHIDFGFLLSNTPGSIGFEMAPFKLPQEYIDILGGYESAKYVEFKELFKRLFRAARKHAERIITLVELMQKDSKLPCFSAGDVTSVQLRERFALALTQTQVEELAEKLVMTSATSTFTRLYDLFQLHSNGIL